MNIFYKRMQSDSSVLQQSALEAVVHSNKDVQVFEDYDSLQKPLDKRGALKNLIHSLQKGDRLYLYDLKLLTPKMEELVKILNCLLGREVEIVIVKYGATINVKSSAAKMVQLLWAAIESPIKRKGRPKGSLSASKYDAYRTQIVQLLQAGKSVSSIAKELGLSRSSLRDYIVSRNLKQIALEGERPATAKLPQCKIKTERIDHGYSS